MSLASTYAAAQATAIADKAAANLAAPPSFVGPNGGSFSVTDDGNLLVTPPPAGGPQVVSALAIPAVVAWLTATFIT